MQTKIIIALTAAAMLCGCHQVGNVPDETSYVSSQKDSAPNEKFYTRTFSATDGNANYLLTLTQAPEGVSVSCENNEFQAAECIVTSPEGYTPLYSGTLCDIYSDEDEDSGIPDLIRLSFTGEEGTVCRFFAISEGAFREVNIFNSKGKQFPCIPRTALYRSEALKFIDSISVDGAKYDGDISKAVKIYTYSFDPQKMTLTGRYEHLSEDEPLYFGYAYWGLANSIAACFADTNFNISDRNDYKEIADETTGEPLYYFKTKDSRFSDMAELRSYLETIFTKDAAQRIMDISPKKVRDIDGSLYTLTDNTHRDPSKGMITFKGYEKTASGNTVVYRTHCKTYDENGVFKGYTDSGDFRIKKQFYEEYSEDTGEYGETYRWIISEYTFRG